MRLSFMKIPDNNTRQLSIFSAETAILAALMNVSIDNCSRDDLAEHLFKLNTPVVTYDSATNKLLNVTKKDILFASLIVQDLEHD